MSKTNTIHEPFVFNKIQVWHDYFQVEPMYKKIITSVKNEETGEVTMKEELNAQEYFKIIQAPEYFDCKYNDETEDIQLVPTEERPTHLLAKIIAIEEIETPESTQDNPSSLYFIDAVNVIAFAYAK